MEFGKIRFSIILTHRLVFMNLTKETGLTFHIIFMPMTIKQR